MPYRLRFWLLLLAMLVPAALLIGQQWLLGGRLARLAVYERDGRVRHAVDRFVADVLDQYRRQNEALYQRVFAPLDTPTKLDEPQPEALNALREIRAEFGRPAALFIARPRGNAFDIRYFALDEQDRVQRFYDPQLEAMHQASIAYVHSMMRDPVFRARLEDGRYIESRESSPYGMIHLLQAPMFLDDPVTPRAYVGLWETVEFAAATLLIPCARKGDLDLRLTEEGVDPRAVQWSIRVLGGPTLITSGGTDESAEILDVRLGAYGPLFETLSIRVSARAGAAAAPGMALHRQNILLLSLAALWLLVAGLLLARAAVRDRRLALLHRNFVGRLGHELKTPVAVLLGAVDSLRNPKLAHGDVRPFVDMLHAQLRRLAGLVDHLIEVARLEGGRSNLSKRPIDLSAWLAERLPELADAAKIPRDAVALDPAETLVELDVDPTALDLMLRNLLENGTKYAHAGRAGVPPMEIGIVDGGQRVGIAVRDHGPGLPRRERRRVFRPFYRVGAELREDIPGQGLGLSLVRSLVEAHGGTVTLDGTPGGGCTFTLWFPRKHNP